MGNCAKGVSTCLQAKGYSNLCECEGDLVQCYANLGCGQQVLSSIESSCKSAGCTSAQCTPSSRRLIELALKH